MSTPQWMRGWQKKRAVLYPRVRLKLRWSSLPLQVRVWWLAEGRRWRLRCFRFAGGWLRRRSQRWSRQLRGWGECLRPSPKAACRAPRSHRCGLRRCRRVPAWSTPAYGCRWLWLEEWQFRRGFRRGPCDRDGECRSRAGTQSVFTMYLPIAMMTYH